MVITSKDNKRIKEIRKLLTKKGRTKAQQFLIEGEHLIEEAIQFGAHIEEIFVLETDTYNFDLKTTVVTKDVMSSLSTLVTPPGIIAVVRMETKSIESDRVLAIDGIQDPGNLGTLIRTADAFNFKRILIGKNTVDPYSDKVLRSSQGSHFHVSLEDVDLIEVMQNFNGTILTTDLSGESLTDKITDEKIMIVLGNEGQGVSQEVLEHANYKVKIDMPGDAESLNVAVAGGILMHQYSL
ncbi:TrmH family RNA methyltransferase [Nosocomiicoccus massiliensis]|uniref:RNA methyltransferase n=1 Tax=Nosocomiicoccus massiliensis TaxID=1232430 RepID=A0AAF0YNB5_9STAP|nr:RNA methyltransferase [Nosocomiicoccus massiliensis]WOS96639.1 RNA methyltransferase [Nosocomiicoccus massiliensis]